METCSVDAMTITVGGVCFRMMKVKGGTFKMGSNKNSEPNLDPDAFRDENPVHIVTLGDYYIGETVVTQSLWRVVMGTTVGEQRDKADPNWELYGEGDAYPIYYVSWDEAQLFCEKLGTMTGKRFRLPTEAEWEYAARGGEKSRGYKFSGSDDIGEVAWHWRNCGDKFLDGKWDEGKMASNHCGTHAVKEKAPNELGIYDMSGNVWEWCQDWYGEYSSDSQINPQGPATGSHRVDRGGSWHCGAKGCRVSLRAFYPQASRNSNLGFRVVLDQN